MPAISILSNVNETKANVVKTIIGCLLNRYRN